MKQPAKELFGSCESTFCRLVSIYLGVFLALVYTTPLSRLVMISAARTEDDEECCSDILTSFLTCDLE